MKILRLIGMALVAITMSVNFAACSDDDDFLDYEVKKDGLLFYIVDDEGYATLMRSVSNPKGHIEIPSEVYYKATDRTYPVTEIAYQAFYGGCDITSVSIPSTVKKINYSFLDCTGLTSVNISNGVTDMEYAFSGCTSLTSVNIPSSVTNMECAFMDCTSLVSANIQGNVTDMETAFGFCTSLVDVHLAEGITRISLEAFGGCESLTDITLPSTITNIGEDAFAGCTNLSTVHCKSITPPTCHSEGVFVGSKRDTLYVPKGSAEAYKKANEWKNFKNIIEE